MALPTMPHHPYRALRCVLQAAVFFGVLCLLPAITQAQSRDVSLDELTDASSDIVVAEVTEKRPVWAADRKRIFTEVRLRVNEQIKGEAAQETVVLVPGGQIGNVLYEVSDMPVFIEGEEVLVFLWRAPDGAHLVTGAAQGKLRVLQDEAGRRVLEPGAARLFLRPDQPGTSREAAPGTPREASPAAPATIRLDAAVRAVREVKKQ